VECFKKTSSPSSVPRLVTGREREAAREHPVRAVISGSPWAHGEPGPGGPGGWLTAASALPLQAKYVPQLFLTVVVIIFFCIFSVFRVCGVVS